jgi:hypothetical protein
MLQEFVQCSKKFQAPANQPILQWDFETRMADRTTLEFRATAAFLLDGVPHHTVGGWHLSKKAAQRDAAERALTFFVKFWAQYFTRPGAEDFDSRTPQQQFECDEDAADRARRGDNAEAALQEWCQEQPNRVGGAPKWSLAREDDGNYCARVEMPLLGVPHHFAGKPMRTEEDARADTARRVLWYLQCPGFGKAFEPAFNSANMAASGRLPAPPPGWAGGASSGGREAARKTLVMRVQNRLQQAFARRLRPGQSAWEWSYEGETGFPPSTRPPPYGRCRATVRIPVAGRTFVGAWAKGNKEAQFDVCQQVMGFLNECESSPGSTEDSEVRSGRGEDSM